MSRFFRYDSLSAYVPGEQPQNRRYVKLNTNESPFAPPARVAEAVSREAGRLQLYSDPESHLLREAIAARLDVSPRQVLPTNGSDEILNFAFMAFGDQNHPIAFPSVSYGFYPVFAALNGVKAHAIPLKDDFSIDYRDYLNLGETIVIANPNAPTGLTLSVEQIDRIVSANPDSTVIIDEAYVDFGAESCVPLIKKHDNLLVTQTFSKSRSMAGARLGYGVGSEALIAQLDTVKYSTNPYNVNRLTAAAGIATLEEDEINARNCRVIAENRAYAKRELEALGFTVTDSQANFLFAASERIPGETLYQRLKEEGVLVRHFRTPEISNYNRVTVGTRDQMDAFLAATRRILEGMS